MEKILVVEDDATFGQMLKTWLGKRGYEAELVTTVAMAKAKIEEDKIDLILSDLRLPDSDGILLLQWVMERHRGTAVILMTSYADIHSAVTAIKLGAFDYLEKPVNHEELRDKITAALKKKQQPQKKSSPEEFIKGEDSASVKMTEYMSVIAPTDMSVLITGESGTGKEYVAKFIHSNSKRSGKPFVAVDCGAISKELGVSEFFGHVKGAFTSAVSDKKGVFQEADGGTIFLDEIGNLSLEIQMQLLRALQERKFRPVGSSKEISVDVRVLAATNENLQKAITEGRFREDLYHRVNEFSIAVPPLRERGDDIINFANYFLAGASEELGKNVKKFSAETEQLLRGYVWSGNLRQMRNIIKRAVLFCQTDTIEKKDLPDEITQFEPLTLPLKRTDERETIIEALARCNGNKSQAAKLLQVDRKTLYNKLKQFNL